MADKKISQLPLLEEIDGTEQIPVAKGGENYSITPAQILENTYNKEYIDKNLLTGKQASQKYQPAGDYVTKTEFENLETFTNTLNNGLGDKEDRVSIEVVSGETLTAKVGRYYRFDNVVNTLNVTLPKVEEINRLKSLVLSFTTGDSPQVTITASDDIAYFSGYSIVPNTTYEINLMFNGTKWIVAYGVVG